MINILYKKHRHDTHPVTRTVRHIVATLVVDTHLTNFTSCTLLNQSWQQKNTSLRGLHIKNYDSKGTKAKLTQL